MRTILVFLLISFNIAVAQKYRGDFSKEEFGLSADRSNFFVDMFDTRQQLLDFMDIHKGDVITEVGAGKGWNLGVLALLYDSITLCAQEISEKVLSPSDWEKTIRYYTAKKKVDMNRYERVMGTINGTGLPDSSYDKILLIDAYHDFDKKDEMIIDLSKKLKTGGRIYLMDGFSFPGDTVVCPDNGKHVLTTLPVEVARYEKYALYLTQMRSPDMRAHYGNAVVFEKDKSRSDEFYEQKKKADVFLQAAKGFGEIRIATDTARMRVLTDSILTGLSFLKATYKEYELWVRELGLRMLRKKEYAVAINILKANTEFFPESYQAWHWLGAAYQANKLVKEAKRSCLKALQLKPNDLTKARLRELN